MNITKHLTRGEIACHCGCGYGLETNDLHYVVAQIFEEIRERVSEDRGIDTAIDILSGCRCWKHHVAIYKAISIRLKRIVEPPKESKHLKGLALDLQCPEGYDYEKFYQICVSVIGDGGGVGYYPDKNFVHIDLRGWKARWNG